MPKKREVAKFERTSPELHLMVIAGNINEYDRWIKEQEIYPASATYLHKESQLRGLRNVEIIHIGNWYRNSVTNSDYWYRLVGDNPPSYGERHRDPYDRVVIR